MMLFLTSVCLVSVCLSDVCLSRTLGLSREQRGPGRFKLAQCYPTSHVTRTHHFQVQSHQAALLTAALTRDAGAAVTTRTYWARESTGTLRLLGGA